MNEVKTNVEAVNFKIDEKTYAKSGYIAVLVDDDIVCLFSREVMHTYDPEKFNKDIAETVKKYLEAKQVGEEIMIGYRRVMNEHGQLVPEMYELSVLEMIDSVKDCDHRLETAIDRAFEQHSK